MISGRYTLIELWADLEADLAAFTDNHPVEATHQDDEEAFQLCNNTMKELFEIGRTAEALNFYKHPIKKAQMGLRAKNLFAEKFGPEQMPPLKGMKSLTFIKHVIVPFQENTTKVNHEGWLLTLCKLVGIDLLAQAEQAQMCAEKNRAIICLHEKRFSNDRVTETFIVATQGFFAMEKNTNEPADLLTSDEALLCCDTPSPLK